MEQASAIENDEALCRAIIENVEKMGRAQAFRPSFVACARKAFDIGRPGLASQVFDASRLTRALKLLEREPRIADQVPLLIRMQQMNAALSRAIQSGDCDLVHLVLFHLRSHCQLADFFRIINGHPIACSLLQVYCQHQYFNLLLDFYYQDDRRVDTAYLMLRTALEEQVGLIVIVRLQRILRTSQPAPKNSKTHLKRFPTCANKHLL